MAEICISPASAHTQVKSSEQQIRKFDKMEEADSGDHHFLDLFLQRRDVGGCLRLPPVHKRTHFWWLVESP